MSVLTNVTMALSGCILGLGLYYLGRNSAGEAVTYTTVFEKDHRLEWIFLGVVLFLAFVVRVWDFGSMPYGMNQDGAMAAIDAKALADHGTDRLGMFMPVHFTAWGYGQMSVLLSYTMIPFIKLFGLNPVTARLPMLIVSMLALYVIYRLMKEWTDVTGAQIALVLAAFTPWHFIQSRWALDCNMFPHMMLFGVYFLYRGIRYRKRNLYLSMLFFALCMYSYGVSFYTVPVFLVAACVMLLVKKRIRIRDMLICIGVYLLFAWPIILTMMINTFGWSTIETPFFTMAYFPDSIRSNDILFFSDNIPGQLAENFKALWHVLMQRDDLPWNTVPGFGTIFPAMIPFAAAGLGYIIYARIQLKKQRQTEQSVPDNTELKTDGLRLLLIWLAVAIFCGLITETVNVNRINILMYCLILLAALGIRFVWKQRHILVYALAGMGLVLFISFLSNYYSEEYTDSMSDIFMGGMGECLQDLEENGCKEYFIETTCHHTESIEVLELQTLFYLQIDAEFYRSEAFSETYHYISPYDWRITDEPDDGYVVPAAEADQFDKQQYKVFVHGEYAAAVPR